jgi:hypothetical protein
MRALSAEISQLPGRQLFFQAQKLQFIIHSIFIFCLEPVFYN